jgi:hypothetical protein
VDDRNSLSIARAARGSFIIGSAPYLLDNHGGGYRWRPIHVNHFARVTQPIEFSLPIITHDKLVRSMHFYVCRPFFDVIPQ